MLPKHEVIASGMLTARPSAAMHIAGGSHAWPADPKDCPPHLRAVAEADDALPLNQLLAHALGLLAAIVVQVLLQRGEKEKGRLVYCKDAVAGAIEDMTAEAMEAVRWLRPGGKPARSACGAQPLQGPTWSVNRLLGWLQHGERAGRKNVGSWCWIAAAVRNSGPSNVVIQAQRW